MHTRERYAPSWQTKCSDCVTCGQGVHADCQGANRKQEVMRLPMVGLAVVGEDGVQDERDGVLGGEFLLWLRACAQCALTGQRFKERFSVDHCGCPSGEW